MNPKLTDTAPFKSRVPDSVSAFIKKTFDMLEEQKFPDIVDWNPEGTAIIIKKPIEFGQKVLPAYFKHNNLTSFVRQLNMYDFHKRRTQKYDHVYYHDLFQRDKRNLLQDIKRKSTDTSLASIQKAIEGLDGAQGTKKEDANAAPYEGQLLKKINKDALARIAALENKVKDLTIQNQSLCSQVSQHKQKEDVLVTLMATFMKKKGITLEQLPKVLQSQFNITPAPMNVVSNLFKEKDANTIAEPTPDIMKLTPSFDSAEFFSFDENANRSMEHARMGFGGCLSDIKNRGDSMNKDIGMIPPNKYIEYWNLIPEKSLNSLNMNSSDSRGFDKRGVEKRELDEKLCFGKESEEEALSRHKPKLPHPFSSGGGGQKIEEVNMMKIKKNDSLTDKFLNLGSQNNGNNIDLLDFE